MKASFCGPPSIRLSQFIKATPQHHTLSWFSDLRVYYTHKARTAIDHSCEILQLKNNDEVLIPSYNCGSEVDPFIKRGVQVREYRITKECIIDIDDVRNKISDKTKLLYVTHYFGYPQKLDDVLQFCRDYKLYLLEDCALSLFSSVGSKKLGTMGDLSVFSFPKSLPVPDGGALVVNNKTLMPEQHWDRKPTTFEYLASNAFNIIKSTILRETRQFHQVQKILRKILTKERSEKRKFKVADTQYEEMPNDYYFSDDVKDRDISLITRRLLLQFASEVVMETRRRNYATYLSLLIDKANIDVLFKELPEGICPLYFPVIVKDRDQICQRLNERLIHAIPWWAGYHRSLAWQENPDACFLKDNLLALPVHQDINETGVEYVSECLIEFTR
jgi:dTDP-4-amino-4,6-dideoxygalactose transaminase